MPWYHFLPVMTIQCVQTKFQSSQRTFQFWRKTKTNSPSIERYFIPFQHSLKAEKQKRERERRFGWANIYFTTELEPPKILSRFAFTTVEAAALQLPKIAVVVIIAPQRETRSSSLLLYTHEKQYR